MSSASKRSYERAGPLEDQATKRQRHNVQHGITEQQGPSHSGGGRSHGRDGRAAAIAEASQMKEWLSKEDDFVLKQAKKRAAIRVREARAKPVDYLAVNLRFVDAERDATEENELEEVDITPKEPSAYLHALHPQELDELERDVQDFYKLETHRQNKAYWKALRVACEDLQARKKEAKTSDARTSKTVGEDIDRILANKSSDQLIALERSINEKLDARASIDVDYWQHLLQSVKYKQAWTQLAEMHALIVKAADEEARRKQVVFRNGKRAAAEAPVRVKLDTVGASIKSGQSTELDFESAAQRLYRQEAASQLKDDEELFNHESVRAPKRPPKWLAKFPSIKPIKPKFFNRVYVGVDWTAYNKAHYTSEDPPPKTVWGYRFNIFYPDLVDSTKAPTYRIERQLGLKSEGPGYQEDLCFLRFTAGPPYEDVVFEIVDKDWDHSSRFDRGYKSSFDKGILQLHFKFKRITFRS
ncbi:mid region of cactin-domain-containing protein [Protomyces lactucae-debilis]|uniref:Splicing factor Cactin n=1 Tax=Protomyces lactucae-debilis TaxID=2754530 RepID=A0A1Y2F981_PROLT|nr:mid region of cactin-domain-containing protein [Protomyces lactucae-debilis]ORY80482.1 mid region of cactin-domain-containing protein [Protomyces lactucae-debilis]